MILTSPAVLGNLWDVTDMDIDNFSMELLNNWGICNSNKQPVSLTASVANARSACKLKFIIGAAPVVYGLPIILQ